METYALTVPALLAFCGERLAPVKVPVALLKAVYRGAADPAGVRP